MRHTNDGQSIEDGGRQAETMHICCLVAPLLVTLVHSSGSCFPPSVCLLFIHIVQLCTVCPTRVVLAVFLCPTPEWVGVLSPWLPPSRPSSAIIAGECHYPRGQCTHSKLSFPLVTQFVGVWWSERLWPVLAVAPTLTDCLLHKQR